MYILAHSDVIEPIIMSVAREQPVSITNSESKAERSADELSSGPTSGEKNGGD
jgi:hypothetical protein